MATHATLNQSPNHRILVISVHAPSLLNLSISSYLIHLDIHRVAACKCHTVTGFNQVPGRAPLQPCNLPRLLFDFLGWYYHVLSDYFLKFSPQKSPSSGALAQTGTVWHDRQISPPAPSGDVHHGFQAPAAVQRVDQTQPGPT